MLIIAGAAIAGALLGAGGVLLLARVTREEPLGVALAAMEHRLNTLEHEWDQFTESAPDLQPITDVLEDMARQMTDFERDLEEGLEVTRRREARVRVAVARAAKRMEESGEIDPGFVAEVEEIQRRDGGESESIQLPTLQGGVDLDQPSSIPGVTLRELWQAEGMI